MKKKILIILAVIVAAGIGVALYFVFFREDNSAPSEESTSGYGFSTNFDGGEQIARYNSTSDTIELYNPDSDEFEELVSIDYPADYVEVSSDKTRALFTLYPDDLSENASDELQTLYSLSVSDPSNVTTTEKVFSPHFLPNGSIIYQSFPSESSSQLSILDQTGKTAKVALPVSNEQEIAVLDSSNVIIYDYSTDVSDATSYLVNLSTGKSSKLTSGNGLQIKTVAGSQYISAQTLADDVASVQILAWKTGKEITQIQGISNGDIDWEASGTDYYFAKSGKLMLGSFSSTQTEEIETVPDPVTAVKILSGNKIYISSPDKNYTISI